MRTDIYTLDRDDLLMLSEVLPQYVIERSHLPGYFSLGAVAKVEDVDTLLGMAQFYINITSEGECFAEIGYIYVLEEYRRQGVGSKLVERINRILKKSDVKTSSILIPQYDDEMLGIETSGEDLEAFFKECSYITTREEASIWRGKISDVTDYIKDKKSNKNVRTISELSDEAFKKMMDNLVENTKGDNPIPEDIRLEAREYDKEISSFYSVNDAEGTLLVHRLGDEAIELVLIRGYGEEIEKRLKALVTKSVLAVEDELSDDTMVIVRNRAAEDTDILEALLPGISEVGMKKYVRLTSR